LAGELFALAVEDEVLVVSHSVADVAGRGEPSVVDAARM